MGKEIERRFLVKSTEWEKEVSQEINCIQGYLSIDYDRIARVRITDDQSIFTVKGRRINRECPEFNYSIPRNDAEEMLKLCFQPYIVKTRKIINFQGYIWEIDVFKNENSGLIIAEIELSDRNENFTKPDWLGEEITEDLRYSNSNLILHPFNTWKNGI